MHSVSDIVRAIQVPYGIEKWNLSIHQNNLCLFTGAVLPDNMILRNGQSNCPMFSTMLVRFL